MLLQVRENMNKASGIRVELVILILKNIDMYVNIAEIRNLDIFHWCPIDTSLWWSMT